MVKGGIDIFSKRKTCAKQQVTSRFPLVRFAAPYLVAAGYRSNRG
jgi:hypothetical protein